VSNIRTQFDWRDFAKAGDEAPATSTRTKVRRDIMA